MTAKQLKTLKAMAEFRQEHGRMPSYRELAKERGINVWAIQKQVAILLRLRLVGTDWKTSGLKIEDAGVYALQKADGYDPG